MVFGVTRTYKMFFFFYNKVNNTRYKNDNNKVCVCTLMNSLFIRYFIVLYQAMCVCVYHRAGGFISVTIDRFSDKIDGSPCYTQRGRTSYPTIGNNILINNF